MDIYLTKDSYGRFIPAFDSDYESAKKIPAGDTLRYSVTRPRNIQFHRKFFAMLETIHRNMGESFTEVYPTSENLRYVLMVLIGEFEIIILPDGTQNKKPKSISFASMDETEFERVYSASLDAALKYFLSGISKEDFERELLNFI